MDVWFSRQSLHIDKGLTVVWVIVAKLRYWNSVDFEQGIWKDKAICIWQYLAGIIGTLLVLMFNQPIVCLNSDNFE